MVDDYWRLVSGIEMYADMGTELGVDRRVGMVLARTHATGWFLSAHHRPGTTAEELAQLAEFATVRAYLLLTQGPTPATWVPGSGRDEWIAWWFADRQEAAACVPDVPDGWW